MKKKEKEDILDKEVLQVIVDKYNEIFSAEKKVANYILKNPQYAVESNVSELAKASGVSDATVIRMCHHLGYSGYYQLRIKLSRDLGKSQTDKSDAKSDNGTVGAIFSRYSKSINAVGAGLSDEKMSVCADIIRNAKIVHIIAIGNTANISRYFGFRLERIGIRSIHDIAPEYFTNHIYLSNSEDVVVAISKSGISKSIIRALDLAKENRMKIIAITSAIQSPVSKLADYVLDSSGEQHSFSVQKNYQYLNEFVVVEALLDFIYRGWKGSSKDIDRPEIILSDYKI